MSFSSSRKGKLPGRLVVEVGWRSGREDLETCLGISYLQQCALLPPSDSWGYTLMPSASLHISETACAKPMSEGPWDLTAWV